MRRVDLYLLFSFDLVGSSRLKAVDFEGFHWVELIQYFHSQCRHLIANNGVDDAHLWKYHGDEVLFYQRIGTAYQVEHSIRAIDRVLAAFKRELAASPKYAPAAELISIRAIAWTAPVLSHAEIVPEKMAALVEQLEAADALTHDKLIHDPDSHVVDFLGPNIDIGFALAANARELQITISEELADFLRGTERPVLDAIIEAGS
jgi:hypothetical protein